MDTLRLSLQRALVGAVTDNLYALTAKLQENHIKLVAYFSGPVESEDWENITSIGAEVIADFPSDFSIDENCISIADAKPQVLDFWAFMRADSPLKR